MSLLHEDDGDYAGGSNFLSFKFNYVIKFQCRHAVIILWHQSCRA